MAEHSSDPSQEGPVGTRAHVRRALAKAKETLTAAHERVARSQGVLAAAERSLSLGMPSQVPLGEAATRAELRAAVTALTRRLRDEGATPELVLVEVKSAVQEHLLPTLGPNEIRDLVTDVVRWAIEAYFDGQSYRQPPGSHDAP